MIKRVIAVGFLALLVCVGFVGCGTGMALDANRSGLSQQGRSIGIFTLTTKNANSPYEARVKNIKLISSTSHSEIVFQTGKPYKMGQKSPKGPWQHDSLDYLVSVDLDSGEYKLWQIEGEASDDFMFKGKFGFPVNLQINLRGGITYLGHITMINRERKDGEQRSGSVYPFIPQASSGFSGGTFDVTVVDRQYCPGIEVQQSDAVQCLQGCRGRDGV